MLCRWPLRRLRQHYRSTQRQQQLYEAFQKDFQQSVSPYLNDEDFFKGYENVIDVESKLPARGQLTLCPTPIGNLGDMTFRSYQALKTADIVACEDTRVTGMLLHLLPRYKGGKIHSLPLTDYPEVDEFSYGLADDFVSHTVKKVAEVREAKGRGLLISFNAHNQQQRSGKLVKMMQSGLSIALTSDAGTPLLSDPGAVLVAEAVKAGVKVEALPGPVAALVALTGSGQPCEKFFFQGYLSKTDSEKEERLRKMQAAGVTSVIYESCHRVLKTLVTIEKVFGPKHPLYVGQELTKMHETHFHGTTEEVVARFRSLDKVYGELTIVIGPSGFKPAPKDPYEVTVDLKTLVSLVESTLETSPRERQVRVSELTGEPRTRISRIVRDLRLELKQASLPKEEQGDEESLEFSSSKK